LLLAQAHCFKNLQTGGIQRPDQAGHGVGLVAHGKDVFVRPRIRCMNNAETQFLWQHLRGDSIPKNCVVQQIWRDNDKRASGTETASRFGKGSSGLSKVLHDHTKGDDNRSQHLARLCQPTGVRK
jgi:hypothetical protein